MPFHFPVDDYFLFVLIELPYFAHLLTSLCWGSDGRVVSLSLSLRFLRIYLSLSPEEEWEKELEAELQDYEVVADGNSHQDSNWESRIQEMLDAEETDLK